MSNEGIIHTSKKIFSVQFHPEAAGGPYDTDFLFNDFLESCDTDPLSVKTVVTLVSPKAYIRPVVHKVLLLGSGGLSIGQGACDCCLLLLFLEIDFVFWSVSRP